jgi:hypothetical protein
LENAAARASILAPASHLGPGLPRMRPPSSVAATMALLGAVAAGCVHTAALDPVMQRMAPSRLLSGFHDGELPSRTEIVAGQLVVHADFPLPGRHRLLGELESLRTEVSHTLGLPISDEPVHLYLFENPERYQDFAARRFPGFPARRAFFVETDTTLSVFAAWQDRVAEDLRHETTHGYVHAVLPAIPLWLDEGIAEFFELPRTEGGLHRAHVAHLAGRNLEGNWRPDVARLESLSSATELSQDHYAEAWCWVHWMLCTTPERRKLLQDYLADLRRDGATAPLALRLRQAPEASIDPAADVRAHLESLAIATGAL